MAIKPCKECGNPLSNKADACPKCGAKINKNLPRWVVWLVFIALFFVLFKACQSEVSNKTKAGLEEEKSQIADNNSSSNQQTSIVKNNWQTQESSDEMRGTKSKTLINVSANQVEFGFPYNGGSHMGLLVRNNAKEKDIMIKIDKGQFLCGIIDGCEVNFKFDNGVVQSISMVESDSHDSDLLFVAHSKTVNSLIKKLETSRKLIIEAKFYQEGARQFVFETDGFKEP